MKILFIADAVGTSGLNLLRSRLPVLKKREKPDVTIVNAENISPGNGTSAADAELLFATGADILTGGNHSLDRGDMSVFDNPYILRPMNMQSEYGHGSLIYDAVRFRLGIISACGTVNMTGKAENPFLSVTEEARRLRKECGAVFVDFHAEASSEKKAMAVWLDGIASAVIGTHTHCQTNDAKILENGTAFISDAGFCGSENTVLGVRSREVVERFAFGAKNKLIQDDSPPYMINGVTVTLNPDGTASSVTTLREIYDHY